MFFFPKCRTPLESAIKAGKLIDMQLPPFRQFNQIVLNDCAMLMTKAAYEACVQLPGESLRNAKVPASFRWGVLYLGFAQAFQDREDDPQEGIFDVNVMMPDGFQIPKSVKVVAADLDGKEAFVFMLPDEVWPPRNDAIGGP
jgi:hypothetical protein